MYIYIDMYIYINMCICMYMKRREWGYAEGPSPLHSIFPFLRWSTRTCCAECSWNNLRAFYVLLLKKRQENETGIYPRTQHPTGAG